MLKLKFCFFTVLLLVLCGCNSSYNLNIKDNDISENIILDLNNLDNGDYLNRDYYPFHNNLGLFYKKEVINNNDGNFLSLNYDYSSSEFANSFVISDCFQERTYENEDNYIYIKLKNLSECFYGDSFDINIKTDNVVTINNADSINDNVYTWHVTTENRNDLLVEFKISKGQYVDNSSNYIFIIFVFCLLVIIFISINLYKRYKFRNKF